jgi:hypothetical protein
LLIKKKGELYELVKAKFIKAGIQSFIVPPFYTPAFSNKNAADLNINGDYTMVFNLFNLPCGVVPVTTV